MDAEKNFNEQSVAQKRLKNCPTPLKKLYIPFINLLEYIKQDGDYRFDGAMFFELDPIN